MVNAFNEAGTHTERYASALTMVLCGEQGSFDLDQNERKDVDPDRHSDIQPVGRVRRQESQLPHRLRRKYKRYASDEQGLLSRVRKLNTPGRPVIPHITAMHTLTLVDDLHNDWKAFSSRGQPWGRCRRRSSFPAHRSAHDHHPETGLRMDQKRFPISRFPGC